MKRILSLAFLCILGGLVAHVGIFYFIRIEFPAPRSSPGDAFRVQYLGDSGMRANPVFAEQAFLQDSAPLFMPTRWNLASRMDAVASLREATEVFNRYQPVLSLPEFSGESLPPIPLEAPDTRIALPSGPAFLLSRLGRGPIASVEESSSEAMMQSLAFAGSVDRELSMSMLPGNLKALAPGMLWPPVRFYLHIVHGIPPGKPIISESSGFTDWDRALQDHIGSRAYYKTLGNGYYRITVYP